MIFSLRSVAMFITFFGVLAFASFVWRPPEQTGTTDSLIQHPSHEEDIFTATSLVDGLPEKMANGLQQSGQFVSTEGIDSPEILVRSDLVKDEIPSPNAIPKDRGMIEATGEMFTEKLGDVPVEELPLPESVNLDVPFFSQAPDADWSLPRKEACEEASIALAAYYLQEKSPSKEEFKQDILGMVELQQQLFGDYIDTDMEQTALLFERFFEIGTVKIIDNPTIEDLQRELMQGHPVVAPFAGRELGNSFFTNGGPRYHVLVIRGYDSQYFYTNDVGTSRGENFPYEHDILMDALHDLTNGDILTGRKRVLVIQ